MKNEKKAINYYSSFYEVSKDLNQKQFYDFNMAIFKVMFFDEHIDNISFEDSILNILWKSVKHSISASVKGYCDKKNIPYDDIFEAPYQPPYEAPYQQEKEKEKEKEKGKGKSIYPTLEEVKEYILEKKYTVDANYFFEFFNNSNWIDSKGNKVKNWKQKLITWNNHSKVKSSQNVTTRKKDEDILF